MHDLLVILFGESIDRTAIWTAVTAAVAVGGVLFAWRQLAGIRKTSRADFAKRFMDSFFTEETRTLFSLVMNSALAFDKIEITENGIVVDTLPYLRIKQEIARQLSGIVPLIDGKTGYSAFEVDDLLLGQFDSLGWYVRKHLIDFHTAQSNFEYYVTKTYEDGEISAYMKDDSNTGTYDDLSYLYNRFKKADRTR